MESGLRRLSFSTLTAQLELCRITCAALERELNRPRLAQDKRTELFWQLDAVMRDRKAALKKLAALELAEQVRNAG